MIFRILPECVKVLSIISGAIFCFAKNRAFHVRSIAASRLTKNSPPDCFCPSGRSLGFAFRLHCLLWWFRQAQPPEQTTASPPLQSLVRERNLTAYIKCAIFKEKDDGCTILWTPGKRLSQGFKRSVP